MPGHLRIPSGVKPIWARTPMAVMRLTTGVVRPVSNQQTCLRQAAPGATRSTPGIVLSFGGARVNLRGAPSAPKTLVRATSTCNQAPHPAGLTLGFRPVSNRLSSPLFVTNILHNVQMHRFESVTESSKASYSTGWKV